MSKTIIPISGTLIIFVVCCFFVNSAYARTPDPNLYSVKFTDIPEIHAGEPFTAEAQVYYDDAPLTSETRSLLRGEAVFGTIDGSLLQFEFDDHGSGISETGSTGRSGTAFKAGTTTMVVTVPFEPIDLGPAIYDRVTVTVLPSPTPVPTPAPTATPTPTPVPDPHRYSVKLTYVKDNIHAGDSFTAEAQVYYDGAPLTGDTRRFLRGEAFFSTLDRTLLAFDSDDHGSGISETGSTGRWGTAFKAGTTTMFVYVPIEMPDTFYVVQDNITVTVLPTPTPTPILDPNRYSVRFTDIPEIHAGESFTAEAQVYYDGAPLTGETRSFLSGEAVFGTLDHTLLAFESDDHGSGISETGSTGRWGTAFKPGTTTMIVTVPIDLLDRIFTIIDRVTVTVLPPPTPAPSATPVPTPSPAPSASPTPKPTQKPTATPTPVPAPATPTPAPAPTIAPTPTPTQSPIIAHSAGSPTAQPVASPAGQPKYQATGVVAFAPEHSANLSAALTAGPSMATGSNSTRQSLPSANTSGAAAGNGSASNGLLSALGVIGILSILGLCIFIGSSMKGK